MNDSAAVWKYPIPFGGTSIYSIPDSGEIVLCGMQNGVVTLWYNCDITAEKLLVRWRVVATGEEYDPDEWTHLGSCQDGEFVWHVIQGIDDDE